MVVCACSYVRGSTRACVYAIPSGVLGQTFFILYFFFTAFFLALQTTGKRPRLKCVCWKSRPCLCKALTLKVVFGPTGDWKPPCGIRMYKTKHCELHSPFPKLHLQQTHEVVVEKVFGQTCPCSVSFDRRRACIYIWLPENVINTSNNFVSLLQWKCWKEGGSSQ